MSKFKPTDEQCAIIDGSIKGEDLIVQAGAGAGKSSTVRGACTAMEGKKILYLVFNKAAQLEAQKSFPGNTDCRTVHSLAHRAVGRHYGNRPFKKVLVKKDVELLGQSDTKFHIGDPVVPDGNKFVVSGYTLVSLARRTLDRFCGSADNEIQAHHVPLYRDWNRWFILRAIMSVGEDAFFTMTPEDKKRLKDGYWKEFSRHQKDVATSVLPIAKQLWKRTTNHDSEHYFTPDMYLKLWAMKEPTLPVDAVFVDEAQDSTQLVRSLVTRQSTQKVAVGDSFQQMYKWRGAEDILKDWPGRELRLTQSFRFGQAVADQANRWIELAGGDLTLRGNPAIKSRAGVDMDGSPTAILCRSNAMCIAHAMKALDAGRTVGVAGGVKQLTSLVWGALKLVDGKKSDHPDLSDFTSWEELVSYSKTPDGQEYKILVRLIDEYGNGLVDILKKVSDENRAEVVVSTMHKAKGLEWKHVLISAPYELEDGQEVPAPTEKISTEECMINYVAVTRAQETLDYFGVSWIDRLMGAA
ncbi:UvrD-helicase domain-containing protein [Streptomyces sp. 5-10]|uniref:UvrD-helicase domain-containing protein n=1 Tax=Streptomyces sp. 5-10 TaxID=878925 RepID=UPI00168A9310|nr:UvrD-helicase domain-containing protein [Streptomyces sp. 5-10]MBD3004867.1 ATP-dependent helicase [Streptomyces sp. 5-10]